MGPALDPSGRSGFLETPGRGGFLCLLIPPSIHTSLLTQTEGNFLTSSPKFFPWGGEGLGNHPIICI